MKFIFYGHGVVIFECFGSVFVRVWFFSVYNGKFQEGEEVRDVNEKHVCNGFQN